MVGVRDASTAPSHGSSARSTPAGRSADAIFRSAFDLAADHVVQHGPTKHKVVGVRLVIVDEDVPSADLDPRLLIDEARIQIERDDPSIAQRGRASNASSAVAGTNLEALPPRAYAESR